MHRDLVDQAKRGDEEAFDALARMVGDRCMAIACRILRDADRAEDAVQAALITAWRELRTLRDPDRFEPWLHPEGILTVNDRDQLERAFRRLTLEQRAVLVFHHYLGLPLPEVADRLGIPRGTAKSRLHHATAALRASDQRRCLNLARSSPAGIG